MKVVLRPLFKDSWSNLKKYRNCYEDITPYWTRSGRIYTGIQGSDKERLEKITSLDLSSTSDYWSNFYIRTNDKDLFLDTSDPYDEIKYLFLKGHRRVKQSLSENKASANFVIINKEEEAKRDNSYARVKRQAFKEFDKLSPTEMRKALRLYGDNADDLNNELVEKRLFEYVEGNPDSFIDKWVNNVARETEVLLHKAISRNIIRQTNNVYKYGSDIIGRLKEEAINFLDDPKNQDIKRVILLETDAKDYIQNREIHTDNSSKIKELIEANEKLEKELKEAKNISEKSEDIENSEKEDEIIVEKVIENKTKKTKK